ILTGDATSPQPEDALEWATRGSAGILGFGDLIGSLEPGKKADLFVVNTRRAHLVPTTRIVSAFIHNGQPGDIESVMVDGCWLMRDGRVLTADEPAIIEEADRIGRRAWNRLVSEYPDVSFPVDIAPG
ncbi:MAG: amidohydrolase family protein, partial [Dehalococcoidia bacterium]